MNLLPEVIKKLSLMFEEIIRSSPTGRYRDDQWLVIGLEGLLLEANSIDQVLDFLLDETVDTETCFAFLVGNYPLPRPL